MATAPVGTLLRRGARRRCPNCGGAGVFSGWFRMLDRCPTCGLRFEREAGFFVGALFVNFAITEVLLFVWIAGTFFLALPRPHVTPLLLVGAALIAVVVPLACYPISKTLWASIHLAMEPLDPAEEADAAAYRFERGDE